MHFRHPSLNEYQNDTIEEAIAQDSSVKALYDRIYYDINLNQDQIRAALIDQIIIPFNTKRLNKEMEDRIDSGGFTVMAVGPGQSKLEPGFAYTVGLAKSRGYELFVSGVSQTTHHAILNEAAALLKASPESTELALPFQIDGQPLRNRLKRVPLENLVNDKAFAVKNHCPVTSDMEGIIILLGDKNNIVPGEEDYDPSFVQYYRRD